MTIGSTGYETFAWWLARENIGQSLRQRYAVAKELPPSSSTPFSKLDVLKVISCYARVGNAFIAGRLGDDSRPNLTWTYKLRAAPAKTQSTLRLRALSVGIGLMRAALGRMYEFHGLRTSSVRQQTPTPSAPRLGFGFS